MAQLRQRALIFLGHESGTKLHESLALGSYQLIKQFIVDETESNTFHDTIKCS